MPSAPPVAPTASRGRHVSVLDEDAWCRACRDLAELQTRSAPSAVARLRDDLAALDGLMRSAPWSVRSGYSALEERALARAAEAHAQEIEAGRAEWIRKAVGVGGSLWAVAVRTRAVDALLAAYDTRRGRLPAIGLREWRTSDGRALVIPARRPRDLGGHGGDGTGYARRGVPNHRIVPVSAGGMPVQVVPLGTLEPRSRQGPLRLGAALFPDHVVDPVGTGQGRFRVRRSERPGLRATVRTQLDALADASVLVWPELTVDDDALEIIADEIARRSFASELPLSLVVAGSWHRSMESGPVGNVSPVLDGTGTRRAEYAKVVRFRHDEFGWEDIERGPKLLVVACDGFTAAVAICKDYCDLGDDAPWRSLDVDLVVVPSMGGATTMAGHLAHAAADRIHCGLRVLVAQHGVGGEGPKGFALLGPRSPPMDPRDTEIDAEWASDTI